MLLLRKLHLRAVSVCSQRIDIILRLYGKVFVRASREASNSKSATGLRLPRFCSDFVGVVANSDIGART
jgi:hypothetical protein